MPEDQASMAISSFKELLTQQFNELRFMYDSVYRKYIEVPGQCEADCMPSECRTSTEFRELLEFFELRLNELLTTSFLNTGGAKNKTTHRISVNAIYCSRAKELDAFNFLYTVKRDVLA